MHTSTLCHCLAGVCLFLFFSFTTSAVINRFKCSLFLTSITQAVFCQSIPLQAESMLMSTEGLQIPAIPLHVEDSRTQDCSRFAGIRTALSHPFLAGCVFPFHAAGCVLWDYRSQQSHTCWQAPEAGEDRQDKVAECRDEQSPSGRMVC